MKCLKGKGFTRTLTNQLLELQIFPCYTTVTYQLSHSTDYLNVVIFKVCHSKGDEYLEHILHLTVALSYRIGVHNLLIKNCKMIREPVRGVW